MSDVLYEFNNAYVKLFLTKAPSKQVAKLYPRPITRTDNLSDHSLAISFAWLSSVSASYFHSYVRADVKIFHILLNLNLLRQLF